MEIKHVDFSLFNKMLLEGTLIKDKNQDTLLYAGTMKVNINDWFFLKDKIQLKYIGLEDATIFLHRSDSVWNYQFIADYFASTDTVKKEKKPINLDLQEVSLRNISILKKDEWRGENMGLTVQSLQINAKEFNLPKKKIVISDINIQDPFFSLYSYKGNRPKRPKPDSLSPAPIVVDTIRQKQPGWDISVNNLVIKNGAFKHDVPTDRQPYYYFDGAHFQFGEVNAQIKQLHLHNDTLFSNITLSTKERSGFEVTSLKTDLQFHKAAMEFKNLDIRTANDSHLSNYYAMRYEDFDKDMGDFLERIMLDGHFINSEVNSDDIAYFAPALKSWKKKVILNGNVKGTISNLSGKGVEVKSGKQSYFIGDFWLTGLPDIDRTFIDVKVNDLYTSYADASLIVPELKSVKQPDLSSIQRLKFKGNYTGFIKDFVAYGSIETNLGTIRCDINMKFPDRGNASYSGKIGTSNFDIGTFIGNKQLNNISFDANVKGAGFTLKQMQTSVTGKVDSIGFNHYTYHNIAIDGSIAKQLFNGKVIIKDESIEGALDGIVDFSSKTPKFKFISNIDHANLKNMNLTKREIDFNGLFDVNFEGNNIDNFMGVARVYDASIFNEGYRISFDSLTLKSEQIDSVNKALSLSSNEIDAAIAGQFNIHSLPDAFQTFLNRYYPSYIEPSDVNTLNENFSFIINTKKIDDYLALFTNKISGFNNTSITGKITGKENHFELDATVPQFSFNKVSFDNTVLSARGDMDSLKINTSILNTSINDSLRFPGSSINIVSHNDQSHVQILASANQAINKVEMEADVQTMKNGIHIQFKPSQFDINGKEWVIDNNGELMLSKNYVTTSGMRLYSGDQEIYLTGSSSDDSTSNDLNISLTKINIGDIAPFFVKDMRLEGLLTGEVNIHNPLGALTVDANANAEQFRLDNDSIGKLQILAGHNTEKQNTSFKIVSNNENYIFNIDGLLNAADSANTAPMSINCNLNNTSITLLQKYLTGIFSKLTGKATGNVQIVGSAKNFKLLGSAEVTDAGLLVDYTKCYYKIPKANFEFKDGYIDFGKFTITDTLKNTGEVTEGKLYHQAFKNMAFDFKVRTNKLLLLNTQAQDNSMFYGNVIGKVNMSLSGPMDELEMVIKGEPTDSSKIYLPMNSSRESETSDFIVWKEYGREMQGSGKINKSTNFNVSLDINANTFAKVYLIMDELTGDVIEATGNGNLRMKAGTSSDFTINGRYAIDKGNYNFSFQGLKKNFTLKPESDNYMLWTGDPMQATMHIEAVYTAENVKFNDLISSLGMSTSNVKDPNRYRGNVLVIAKITDRLTEPKIQFDLELPQGTSMRNDPEVAAALQVIRNDENELNKQVSFLILFGSFAPVTSAKNVTGVQSNFANTAFEGIVVSSISGFLSSVLTKEFSSLLQDVFNDKSIKVNINATLYNASSMDATGSASQETSTSNQFAMPDRTNFNFSVAKSFINDRLTFVVGSALDFGLTGQQSQAAFQFLPDVSVEYKLTPDGKFRLTFFYRDNYSYIAGEAKNRSGVGISYRKEFNRFGDIFKRDTDKKKKKEASAP